MNWYVGDMFIRWVVQNCSIGLGLQWWLDSLGVVIEKLAMTNRWGFIED
jgi:hypothetical protein